MLALIDLPVPVHGMSNINKCILKQLIRTSDTSKALNTVPSYAARFFPGKLWVVIKTFHTFFAYFRLLATLIHSKHKTVYRPINGGAGQVFDLVFVMICRAFGVQLFIHHHSFNYLNKKSALFNALNWIAGEKTTHIALGNKMKVKLAELYGIPEENIIVLSNLAFFPNSDELVISEDNEVLVIGHLANLSIDKGLDVFLDTCSLLRALNTKFIARIAGPFSSEKEKVLVEQASAQFDDIEYLGPVYGEAKDQFFQSLDCFVFPSKYQNEAEPLVLYEAAQFGALLTGTRRGCMQDVIAGFKGRSFDECPDLAAEITSFISDSKRNLAFSKEARLQRFKLFNQQKEKTSGTLSQLLNGMIQHEIPRS